MGDRTINSIFSVLFAIATWVLFNPPGKAPTGYYLLLPLATAVIAVLHYSLRNASQKMEMISSFNVNSAFAIIFPALLFFNPNFDWPIYSLTAIISMFGGGLAIATGFIALKRLKSKKDK
jgi:O-antigen/teichoic acid export membrane protein